MLVLLVAAAGGAVLAAAAGALRTGSAYQRFLVASRASDMLVTPANTGLDGYYGALARMRAAVAPLVGLNARPLQPDGKPAADPVQAPADGRFGHLLDIPKLLSGRLPRPDRPGEVAVDQIGANTLHLHVGSTLVLCVFTGLVCSGTHVRKLSERVVGIVVTRARWFRSPIWTRSRPYSSARRSIISSVLPTGSTTGHL